eukprot:gene9886-10896_t
MVPQVDYKIWLNAAKGIFVVVFLAIQLAYGKPAGTVTCLDEVNGQNVRGFKTDDKPWLEQKCFDGGYNYCSTIFNVEDRKYCNKICCGPISVFTEPSPSVAPGMALLAKTVMKIATKEHEKGSREKKGHQQRSSYDKDLMWYTIAALALLVLICCAGGGFFIRYLLIRVRTLERTITHPSNHHPVDNGGDRETVL